MDDSHSSVEDEYSTNLPKRKRLLSYQCDDSGDDGDFRCSGSENGDSTWKPTESDLEEVGSYYELSDEDRLESFIEIHKNHSNGDYSYYYLYMPSATSYFGSNRLTNFDLFFLNMYN